MTEAEKGAANGHRASCEDSGWQAPPSRQPLPALRQANQRNNAAPLLFGGLSAGRILQKDKAAHHRLARIGGG